MRPAFTDAHIFTGKTLELERLYGHFRLKSPAHASVLPPGAMRLWLPRLHVTGTIVGWQNASNRHSTRSAKKQKIVSESGAKWFSIVMNASKLCLPARRADENPLFLFAIKHPETPRNRVQNPSTNYFPFIHLSSSGLTSRRANCGQSRSAPHPFDLLENHA